MTKLDEIQERLKLIDPRFVGVSGVDAELASMLCDIVSELRRIDAERKAMDKVLIELAARDT